MKKLILSVIYVILYTTCTYAYNNLALRKPAWQAKYFSQSRWGADKAVDGNYTDRGSLGDQCTVSADKQQTAEWRVDLESVVSISYINIFYRTDNNPGSYAKRFAGFYVYVSNTSSKENGILCFHELQTVSGTPLEDQRINCSMYGRYVIYYNERLSGVVYPSYYSQYAFNELCEVEVYGCPVPGYYGVYCNKSCPVTCQGQQCDAVTGNCVKGCLPEYQGPHCSYLNLALGRPAWQKHNWPTKEAEWGAAKAVDGKYSDRGATGGQCTISDFNQRTAEWRVDLEKIVSISHIHIYYRTDNVAKCEGGLYGYNCDQTCGRCINNSLCHHINGTCLEGCSTGHKEPLCKNECDGGMYGEKCDRTCGHCFDDRQCHHINGTCLQGCSIGYKGLLCTTECDGGMFGINCNQGCGYCLNDEQCHHINGSCLRGCSKGYQGVLCNAGCQGGYYGHNCNESCGHCMNNATCDHINGTCPGRCSVGYEGLLCTNVCRPSYWGVNCKETCSKACFNQTCHHETGHCISYEQSQSCETCKVDYTITITSVTVSVLIVLMGSLLNFYIWRKMQQKGTVLDTQNEKVYYNEFSAVDSRDKQSGRDVVTSPYAELSELDHQNTYEELHQYEKADGKM